MIHIRAALAVIVAVGVTPKFSSAQEQPMSQREHHEKLGFFVGEWTVEGLPEGTSFRETCEWYEGRFHVVCRSAETGADGSERNRGMSIFGYSRGEGAYTYYGLSENGRNQTYSGQLEGDVWRFTSVDKVAAGLRASRVTMRPDDKGFHFELQSSLNGEAWRQTFEVQYVRVKY